MPALRATAHETKALGGCKHPDRQDPSGLSRNPETQGVPESSEREYCQTWLPIDLLTCLEDFMHSRILLCLAPLVPVPLAHGQGALPPIRFDYNDETPWPTGQTAPLAFARQIAGDFDHNGLMDVMLLEKEAAGGKVVFYPQPDSWPFQATAWETNGPLVSDIDLIPASAGQPASVAMVGANGLDMLIYAPDNSIPVNGGRMGAYFAWDTISHAALWQGAKLVRTGQLDAGGTDLDYVGVKDSVNASTQQLESTVVVRQKIGSNTTTISFTLPGVVVHDAFIGQWNDTADNEIFLLDTSGVEVYTPAGVRVRRFVRPYADDGQDVFCGFKKNIVVNDQQVADPKLHVAWFRRKVVTINSQNVDHQELVELNAPAVTIGTGIEVDYDTRVVSATAGDSPILVNGSYAPADANQELAVQTRDHASPIVYRNVGPMSGYSAGHEPTPPDASHPLASFVSVGGYSVEVSDGENPGTGLVSIEGADLMAAPLLQDLSGDGLADLFIAAHGQDIYGTWHTLAQVFRGSNSSKELATAATYESTPGYLENSYLQTINSYSYISGLSTGLDLTTLYLQLQPPTGANAVEVFAWMRDATTGAYSALAPYSHGYYIFVPPATALPGTFMIVRVPVPSDMQSLGTTYSFNNTQYVYEVHFAQLTGGTLTAVGTNYVILFGENNTSTLNLINPGYSDIVCTDAMPPPSIPEPPPAYYCCQTCSNQPISGPVTYTRRRLPPLPNGSPAPLPLPAPAQNYQTAGSIHIQ